eukprot:m.326488 g.326488  ORF g.326488 m.326488 type:complete len:59 (-) comp44630_c0_seq1:122-298(-)
MVSAAAARGQHRLSWSHSRHTEHRPRGLGQVRRLCPFMPQLLQQRAILSLRFRRSAQC